MILNDRLIRTLGIVTPCEPKGRQSGMSYGLSVAGYDVRADIGGPGGPGAVSIAPGCGVLVATRERFAMPSDVVGMVRDKSTWARQGVLVNQGVLEPGWTGHLSVWLANSGRSAVWVRDGDPIAQVVFHMMTGAPAGGGYDGKYQNQAPGPQGPKFEGDGDPC